MSRQILLSLFTIILVYQVRSTVRVPSSQLFVPFGENVWLNCSTPDPADTNLESRLKKINTMNGTNWAAFEVFVDDWENSAIYCMTDGKETWAYIVMAYALPSNVTIDLQTELEEGKEHKITCSVNGVAPLQYLTVYITRGGEVISNKSYAGPHVRNITNVNHSYTFNASRSDNLMNFSCEAVLQLGSERHTVNSSEITARTYTLPDAPVISVQEWIEIGTSFTAECLVTNGFPPQDVRLTLFIHDTPVDVITVVTDDGTIKGTAYGNASDPFPGLRTIRCESELFTSFLANSVNVTFYELPTVTLALSRNITDLGEDVTATCDIANKHPGAYGLSIIVDGEEEQNGTMFTMTHTFTASRRTPHLDITCTAYVIGNSNLFRSATQTLQVHYPPEITEDLCPSTLFLVEGKTRFSCQADGNPEPTVECSNNGSYINDMVTVTKDMSGSYTCIATNQKGNATKEVNVMVQYRPSCPILTVIPNATITTGNPLNITCRSDGSPAPTYSWQIPINAGVTYSPDNSSVIIHTATWAHSGTYTCVARNVHGGASEKQEVTVVSDVNIGLLVGIVAAILVLLLIGATVGYIWWKKGRKGFYELLANNKSKSHQNGGVPPSKSNTEIELESQTTHEIPSGTSKPKQ
ncbi:intercellular adhesion molecule 1-like [Dendropsophus ebraccatus]|uniref:intercellular adhesion molecule 1-like n=1 Tax=Dendropsophus ebraccatus TaxID=150705 RepID=UPI0038319795